MANRRRLLAIIPAVLAVVALAVMVVALLNPWRYTTLFPLGHRAPAVALSLAAGLLLGGAAVLTFDGTMRKVLIGLGAVALCVVPALTLPVDDRPRGQLNTMDVSPDGRFEVVKFTVDGSATALYIRSRAGLFSREAESPIATCDHDPFLAGAPREAVRFTSEVTVAVPINDEETAVVSFDPDTLAPDRTVGLCPAEQP